MTSEAFSSTAEFIAASLSPAARSWLAAIEVFESVDSTNAWLLAAAGRGAPSGTVCLAGRQLAGRGRRGRHWASPPGGNLYLSLLWRFSVGPSELQGLSIATGIACAQVLRDLGAADIGLKWPNDLYWDGRKLGGILLEMSSGNSNVVVAGIGINGVMPKPIEADIDQPWTDLAAALSQQVSPDNLAAALLNVLLPLYAGFPQTAADLPQAWAAFDILADRTVELHAEHWQRRGIARGVDAHGALLLDTINGRERHVAGEVSLRPLA